MLGFLVLKWCQILVLETYKTQTSTLHWSIETERLRILSIPTTGYDWKSDINFSVWNPMGFGIGLIHLRAINQKHDPFQQQRVWISNQYSWRLRRDISSSSSVFRALRTTIELMFSLLVPDSNLNYMVWKINREILNKVHVYDLSVINQMIIVCNRINLIVSHHI